MRHRCLLVLSLLLLLLPGPLQTSLRAAERPDDAVALAGLHSVKAIFDISRSRPQALLGALNLVAETAADLQRQGVPPDLVVVFRGPAVTLLTADDSAADPEVRRQHAAIAGKIRELHQTGVNFGVCAIATRLFKVDNQHLLAGLPLVGNALVSLIAYQNRGYALVPLY